MILRSVILFLVLAFVASAAHAAGKSNFRSGSATRSATRARTRVVPGAFYQGQVARVLRNGYQQGPYGALRAIGEVSNWARFGSPLPRQ